MNNEFEERGYKLIDLNLGYEELIAKTFEECTRANNIQPNPLENISPNPIDIYMEHLASIVHRDYITSIVEKETGLKLIPTYCYVRKYFQGSILGSHTDRAACEISLTYCISGPEWEINMEDNTLITKIGNGVIYKGCEIPHGRSKPSSGEVIQVFNHWVISDGAKSNSAYDDGKNRDFYKNRIPIYYYPNFAPIPPPHASLFNIPYWKIQTINFEEKKKELTKLLDLYPEEKKGMQEFATNRQNNRSGLIEQFIPIMSEEMSTIAKEVKKDLEVSEIWSTSYDKGDNHQSHNHGSMGLTGILYLNLPKDSPVTVYIQPWQNYETDECWYVKLPIVEGDIVIVPSFVFHFSDPNKSNSKKRIISWDMKIL